MTSPSSDSHWSQRLFAPVFVSLVCCWLVVAYVHLYFFGYPSVDTWAYAAPAITARAPLEITTPFLGAFEGSDKAWGLHWPGGPLLTSIITPFLPHNPAVDVSIYLCYWVFLCLATMTLVWRLTGSQWLALCGFLFVAGDRICFGVTWMERYELLDSAIAVTAILALCGRADRHPLLRLAVIGAAFFLFPLLQPITTGLGLAWLVCVGLQTWALKRQWTAFWVAAAGTAAGWACFLGYYLSRPWLYALFLLHARQNVIASHEIAPLGIGTFVRRFIHIGDPTKAAAIVYLVALGGTIYLIHALWKARGGWREFVAREELMLFAAVALVCNFALAQFSYTDAYWAPSWPFAVAILCQIVCWLLRFKPGMRRLWTGALLLIPLAQCSYLPAKTWLWHKRGFVDLRAKLRDFAATLPQGGRIFIPESLFETYASNGRGQVYMNAIPALLGEDEQKKYAAYIKPLMHRGDVIVTDAFQWSAVLIDPHSRDWKEIGSCNAIYDANAGTKHGFALIAYQKQSP